jgi:Flp pilus assembly protein TadG
MNNPSLQRQPTPSRIPWRNESGQAMVEMSFMLLILIVLAYGLMDFCVAIYEKQVIVNLTREGANLSARGSGGSPAQIMTNALDAIIQEASPLNLSTNSTSGLLILTAATNSNGKATGYFIRQQLKSGKLSASSKVGSGVGTSAKLPNSIVAQAGHVVYIAEIYYKFNAPAPLQNLVHVRLTNQFYDVAYFPGG